MWKGDQAVTPPGARRDPSAEAGPAASRSTETPVMDLGKAVVIKGELSGSEDLALYGQMEGSIRLPDHTLTIGPHAEIKAQISVKAVVILGAVTGHVTAGEEGRDSANWLPDRDIVSPRLAIADGGCLRGRVEMPQSDLGHGR